MCRSFIMSLLWVVILSLCWTQAGSLGIAYFAATGAATCAPGDITAILVLEDNKCSDISLGDFQSFKIQCENAETFRGTVCSAKECGGTCSTREHVDITCDGSGEQVICKIPDEIEGSKAFGYEVITWTSTTDCNGDKSTFLVKADACIQLNGDVAEYLKLSSSANGDVSVAQYTDSKCQTQGSVHTIADGVCSDVGSRKVTVKTISGTLEEAYQSASGATHISSLSTLIALLFVVATIISL